MDDHDLTPVEKAQHIDHGSRLETRKADVVHAAIRRRCLHLCDDFRQRSGLVGRGSVNAGIGPGATGPALSFGSDRHGRRRQHSRGFQRKGLRSLFEISPA